MNFFRGCYGFDLLSILLIFISSIFNLWHTTRILGSFVLIYALFRVLSKDTYKRKKEYTTFYTYGNKVLSKIGISLPYNATPLNHDTLSPYLNSFKYKLAERKQYKITKCPSCGQKLRLPRGKGKMTVTCKKCLEQFKFRT